MDYVITNGRVYIKLNENGVPITCVKDAAQKFNEEKARNILKSLPKIFKKFHFALKKIPNEVISDVGCSEKNNLKQKELDEESQNLLSDLDDFYKDYEEKLHDKDNPYTYCHRTYIEDNFDNIPGMLKDMVVLLSQMDDYIQNMRYMICECDLKILDIRHYKRKHDTKLGTVHMAKLGYLQQELERLREKCKRNLNCCLVFSGHLDRLQNEKYINVIDRIENSKYRYRRLDEDMINKAIGRNA